MEKLANVLAWKLNFVHSDGQHWQLFINSHGGGIVKANFLGDDGRVRYVIRRSDYRQTDGFTFPHRIEYFSADNLLLAVEEIDRVVVIADAAGRRFTPPARVDSSHFSKHCAIDCIATEFEW